MFVKSHPSFRAVLPKKTSLESFFLYKDTRFFFFFLLFHIFLKFFLKYNIYIAHSVIIIIEKSIEIQFQNLLLKK